MDSNLPFIIAGIVYLLACICVGAVANERGWDSFTPILISLVATPLIGAILYSPYKLEEKEQSKEL
jgi:hypothetical protein